jgi:ABC-type branched-subunit amino acid transport system substrate-binding protein
VIVLGDDQEDSLARADAFARELEGSSTSLRRKRLKTAADLPVLVETLKEMEVGVVLLVAVDPELVADLRSKLQPIRPRLAWLYAGSEAQMTALEGVPRATNDLYLATAYFAAEESEKAKRFAQEYQQRFAEAADVHAVLGHDAAALLCEAIRRSKSADPGRVRDELGRIDSFEGLTGTIAFATDHTARRPLFVVKFTSAGPQLIFRQNDGK